MFPTPPPPPLFEELIAALHWIDCIFNLQSVTKFVGTLHDYADLKLSQLTPPPHNVVLTRVSEPICKNNIVGGQGIV